MPSGVYERKCPPWNKDLTAKTDSRIRKYPCSEEAKKKISIGNTGNIVSIETRKKQSIAQTGKRKHKVEPKVCPVCGIIFPKPTYVSYKNWEQQRKCCSTKCKNKYFVGDKHHNYKKEVSLETRKKLSVAGKGLIKPPITEETRKKQRESHLGNPGYWQDKKRDIDFRIKLSMSQTGETEFKGFVTDSNVLIRHLTEYSKWRTNVYKRDNFTCQMCGERGNRLVVHHIDFFNRIIKRNKIDTIEKAIKCSELWDEDNGITFCKECHDLFHKYMSK